MRLGKPAYFPLPAMIFVCSFFTELIGFFGLRLITPIFVSKPRTSSTNPRANISSMRASARA